MNKKEQLKRLFAAGINAIAVIEGLKSSAIEKEFGNAVGKTDEMIRKYKSGKVVKINQIEQKVIEWLAENAVKRGQKSKAWLKNFLECVDYPQQNDYIISLFPEENNRTSMLCAGNNLPTPNYSKFVMRDDFDTIISGLENQSAVILIKSLGGNGKTSLALEVAKQCISLKPEYKWLPKFTSAIWISDKNNKGATNLSSVLDTIAETLGYNDILKESFENKNYQIKQILKNQKLLLIIDNFETIKDKTLSKWLINIPEPSKCIITTRMFHQDFRNNTKNIEIAGLELDEARLFINNYAETINLPINDIGSFDSLIEKVEGNPKAIEMTLGIIKHCGRNFNEAIQDVLHFDGDLFHDLFDWAWDLLNTDEKKILEIMSMFPHGTDDVAIGEISQMQDKKLKDGLSKLNDLSLVNREFKNDSAEIYYSLHSLVDIFASQKFDSDRENKNMRDKWMDYYKNLSSFVVDCWQNTNTEDLKRLDAGYIKEGLEYSVDWALKNNEYDYVLTIAHNVHYYYYIRGLWTSSLKIENANAIAASKLSKYRIQFEALADCLNLLSKQENIQEGEKLIPKILSLKNEHESELTQSSLIIYNHARAIFHLKKKEYEDAIDLWKQNVINIEIDSRQLDVNSRWLGIAYYENDDFENARKYLAPFANLIKNSKNHNALSAYLYVCKMDMCENKEEIFERISIGLQKAKDTGDSVYIAEFEYLLGKYYKQGDKDSALEHFHIAKNTFNKSGCFNKLNAVQKEIDELA